MHHQFSDHPSKMLFTTTHTLSRSSHSLIGRMNVRITSLELIEVAVSIAKASRTHSSSALSVRKREGHFVSLDSSTGRHPRFRTC